MNSTLENVEEEQKQQIDSSFRIMNIKELVTLERVIPKARKIIVNLSGTKYNVIWNLIENDFQWDVTEVHSEDWNLLWNDSYISEDDLRKMMPYQKINHFPGSHHLGKKNELGKNLRQMLKVHPKDYDFFPKTWLLPYQNEELTSKKNMSNMCMHLTNYAINKKSKDFVFNKGDDSVGHKRSFSAVLQILKSQGHNIQQVLMSIRQVIVKTLCSVQPYLSHVYRACQPRDDQNEQCFELFGFDIILDENLKAWLLEVNHAPSFATDTQLDLDIKKSLISDTLILLNLKNKMKKQFYEQKRAQNYVRPQKKTLEERQAFQLKMEKFEKNNLNGFICIYPTEDDPTNYNVYMDSAQLLLDEWAGTTKIQTRRNPNQNSSFAISTNNQYQRKQSLPSKETKKRPQSGILPNQMTARPFSSKARVQQTISNVVETDPMNSSLSVIDIESINNVHIVDQSNDFMSKNLDDQPRSVAPQKSLKPLTAKSRVTTLMPHRVSTTDKRIREPLHLPPRQIYPMSLNTWMPPVDQLHPLELLKNQILEEQSSSYTVFHSRSGNLKTNAEYIYPANKQIQNQQQQQQQRKNEIVNESFKIKKVQIVPIKTFNFKDKLTNLLNIHKE